MKAGGCAVRVLVLAAVLSVAGVPVSGFYEAKVAVPLPPPVHSEPLPAAAAASWRAEAAEAIFVRLNGRKLALSLVRSGSAGVAVLSVPETSLVPALPDIAGAELLEMLRSASGCRVEGSFRTVAGRQGAVAVSAALDCSGS